MLFAQLARRTGKAPLLDTGPGHVLEHGSARVDLGMWRVCDAVGYVLAVEEPLLEKRFGAEYAEYAQRTPRWVGPARV